MCSLTLCLPLPRLAAEEGMWLPNRLQQTCAVKMERAGCQLPPEAIYSRETPSLKDAIVRFANGCTGEVVSADGLLFTNHHCGYEYVQSLSSVEHNYLENGFAATSRAEELPCPGLKVRFLEYMDDVTPRIAPASLPTDETARAEAIKQNIAALEKELKAQDASLDYDIKPLYYGNQYYLYVYRTYRDVRLVVAPPAYVGKFGGDTDNWDYPRHTGDFTFFRIYADAHNAPADYHAANVPYHPRQFLKIQIGGVQPEEFVMVYGYPGTTQQYLTSDAVSSIATAEDPRKVALRRQRLDIMEGFMNPDEHLRLQYSSKHASVANAWKKWIGESKGLQRLNAVCVKQAQEAAFEKFANATPERKAIYGDVLASLHDNHASLTPLLHVNDYYTQGLLGIESLAFAIRVNRLISKALDEKRDLTDAELKELHNESKEYFKDYDLRVDRALAQAMFREFVSQGFAAPYDLSIPSEWGNEKGFAQFEKKLLGRSVYTDSTRWHKAFASPKTLENLQKDPLGAFARTLAADYKAHVADPLQAQRAQSTSLYRRYVAGLMEMQPDRVFFPDANSTMRLAFGKVEGYSPREGIVYTPFTTLDGVFEKVEIGAHDYTVGKELRDLYEQKDYGRWSVDGKVPACFLSSVHTTGGNSGSPVLNAKGELVGLNFDRVWEGTMSDVMFDPAKCRNIVVDIRYVLFLIEKLAGAGYLLEEMELVR